MSLVLPLSDWPPADREMWEALRRTAGPLDDPGALSHLRDTSLKTLRVRYGRWLQWLVTTDPAALAEAPADRASLPRLKSWLLDLEHTKPMSRLMFIDATLHVLESAEPDRDWSKHNRLKAALKRLAGRGDPARKRGRVLSSEVLLKAGLKLATETADGATTPLRRLVDIRDGTMIALLSLLPMRRRSFCELTLGQSVLVTPTTIMVSLSEDMTKTGRNWEVEVPPQVEPLLRRYIKVVRPALMARGYRQHDRLWVCKKGEVFEENYLGMRVGNLTLELTGKRIPPHFFRDAAATTLARMSPEAAKLIRPVLAHSGFKTAERHYIHAQTIDAGRTYADVVRKVKTVH